MCSAIIVLCDRLFPRSRLKHFFNLDVSPQKFESRRHPRLLSSAKVQKTLSTAEFHLIFLLTIGARELHDGVTWVGSNLVDGIAFTAAHLQPLDDGPLIHLRRNHFFLLRRWDGRLHRWGLLCGVLLLVELLLCLLLLNDLRGLVERQNAVAMTAHELHGGRMSRWNFVVRAAVLTSHK